MSHDVFVCHSSEDRAVANAICSTLEQHRIRCWIAPRDVVPGSDYAASIVEAITGSRLAVLVFSEHSNHSVHVHREIERAVSHGLPIIPFRLQDVAPSPSLEYFISNSHWLDAMTPPLEQHLQHLVGTVRALLGSPLPPPSMPVQAPAHTSTAAVVPAAPVRRPRWRWLLGGAAALVALVVGLVVVTGGDDSATPTTEPTTEPTTVTTDGPSTTRPSVPVTTLRPETSVAPGGSVMAPIDALDSYTFTLTMAFTWEGNEMTIDGSGTYVAPDSQECRMTFRMADLVGEFHAVVIGDRAWYAEPGSALREVSPDDPTLTGTLAACASDRAMWSEDFGPPPPGGEDVTIDGLDLVSYDVTELADTWGEFFGLPTGVHSERMVMYTSADRSWVAGMDARLTGAAEVFTEFMGIPPAGVTGECTFDFTLFIRQPNDPSLVVVAPM